MNLSVLLISIFMTFIFVALVEMTQPSYLERVNSKRNDVILAILGLFNTILLLVAFYKLLS